MSKEQDGVQVGQTCWVLRDGKVYRNADEKGYSIAWMTRTNPNAALKLAGSIADLTKMLESQKAMVQTEAERARRIYDSQSQ